jgi:hypothetical protein
MRHESLMAVKIMGSGLLLSEDGGSMFLKTWATTCEGILCHNQQEHNLNGEGRLAPAIFMIQITSQKDHVHV